MLAAQAGRVPIAPNSIAHESEINSNFILRALAHNSEPPFAIAVGWSIAHSGSVVVIRWVAAAAATASDSDRARPIGNFRSSVASERETPRSLDATMDFKLLGCSRVCALKFLVMCQRGSAGSGSMGARSTPVEL